jgi:arylsulfatase A-like enzyme
VNEMTQSVDVPATVLDLLEVDPLPIQHGRTLRPYLTNSHKAEPLPFVFSEYLENEEACLRTDRWKFVFCSGRRARTDGYATSNPAPGRYVRLFDRKADPGELNNVAARNSELVNGFQKDMLALLRKTHPEAVAEPNIRDTAELLDWYLRPRDAKAVEIKKPS